MRKRGRRPKGQRNLHTIIADEGNRKITVREGGVERKATKLEATVIRAYDNASSKGQVSAMALLFNTIAAMMELNKVSPDPQLEPKEQAIVDSWLKRRMAELEQTGDIGDPNELPADSEDLNNEGDDEDKQGGDHE